MKLRVITVTMLAAFFAFSWIAPATAAASDWVGIYARIDKVVFEPNAAAPERIQIWGAFALASRENRGIYDTAKRGYLYYSIVPGKEDACRKEWADLKAVAGSDVIIGFASRGMPFGRVRKSEDKPANPDTYTIASGLTKFSGNTASSYGPIRELRSLPREPK